MEILTQTSYSASLLMWSILETKLKKGLVDEITRDAIMRKNEIMSILDKALIDMINPTDKLIRLKSDYRNYSAGLENDPNLNFDTTNLFSKSYYSHRIGSIVESKIKEYQVASGMIIKNSDHLEMFEFISMYHDYFLSILRAFIELEGLSERERLINTSSLDFLYSAKRFEDGYEQVGYVFDDELELAIKESFTFLISQLPVELKKLGKLTNSSLDVQVRKLKLKLIGYVDLLQRCSTELIEHLIYRITSSLITNQEKATLKEELAIAFVKEEINGRITSIEGDNYTFKPKRILKLKSSYDIEFLKRLYTKLSPGYISSDLNTFLDFFAPEKGSVKLNWNRSYQELWCFLQCMFSKVIESPYNLNFSILEWSKNEELEYAKVKRDFSEWLNKVLGARMTVQGDKYSREKIKDPKHKPAEAQDEYRQVFFEYINS